MPTDWPLPLRPIIWCATTVEPLARAGDADRQLGEHGGDVVAQLSPVLARCEPTPAPANGSSWSRRPRPRDSRYSRKPPATAASTTSLTEQPGSRLDPLDVGELGPRPAPPPVRAERAVEHAGRGGRPASHAGQAVGPHGRCLRQVAGCRDAATGRTAHRPGRVDRQPRDAHHAGCREPQSRRRSQPGATRANGPRPGLGRAVEQHLHQLVPGEAVDHRVVRLGDQRPPAAGQPLDEPQLPQRAVRVEPLREHPAEQRAQLLVAAGCGNRGVPQVVVEQEVRVVDPHRAGEVERHPLHPLAVAGQAAEAGLQVRGELVVGRCRALEDQQRADVHLLPVVLELEEAGVERAEPLHGHLRSPDGRLDCDARSATSGWRASQPRTTSIVHCGTSSWGTCPTPWAISNCQCGFAVAAARAARC